MDGYKMLKYNDQEQHTVIDTTTGQVTAQGHWGWEAWLQPRLDAGETIAPWKTKAELLEEARAAKAAEINAAFALAEQRPVSVGGHKFKGGFESGLALDAQRRMLVEYAAANPLAGISTADLFDIHGATVTLPLNSETELDALDVCLAVGQAAAINSFKCAQLIAAVRAANSIEAVSTIHW